MKTIEMLYRVTFRYCRQAFGIMEELRSSGEEYENLEAVFKQALEEEEKREVLL